MSIKDNVSRRYSRLSPAKQLLLEQRLRGEFFRNAKSRVIPRRKEQVIVPLSFAQQRLWFLDQLEPGSIAYNIPRALSLSGALNVEVLVQSLNEIVRRHEALRTTFTTIEGEPVQVITPKLSLTLPVIELSHLSRTEREVEAQRLTGAEARRPFDLSRGPLLRATLLQLAPEEHILLLTVHHIVSDGWSLGVFFHELASFYEAFSAGKPSPLPELPIQYADYAVWHREWLQGEVLEKQLSYWRGQLTGAPAALELPTDKPRPVVQTSRGAHHSATVPKSLAKQLKVLAQREGVTLYMLLLATFQVLLSRYSGREDIVVGSPIAGRNRAETEGLIGFFVNTLVMRTDLSGDPTFLELLERVREVALDAYAHQDLSFEKLVEELQPERSLSYSPLVQVMFDLSNVTETRTQLLDLKVNNLDINNVTSRFDLILFVGEETEDLSCCFEYSTDLFDASTITRLADHFQTLLERIVVNPESRLSELPLTSEADRHQLLVEWNNTQADYPRENTIHQLFEEQVRRTPDAVAVLYDNKQLTYRELNERANQLAHYLQRLAVGPEVMVGICVERSLEMVIGLLGILKSGGAYVPLDLAYPQERLSFILEDARAPVLLTQERLLENLPSHAARVVGLDRDWKTVSQESRDNPKSGVRSDNLAYIIYTSGSTGRPKGVAIEHHSTVALVEWTKAVFSEEDLKGVLASTSICFDLSVFELFVTLSRGGTIIMAEDALQLMELEAANEVTLINTVPSAIAELVRVGGIPATVRTINLAGELLSQSLVESIYKQEGIERVFDLYGPSEDTTYSTYALRRQGGVATIGRPISNTQVYILDKQMEPVPIGIPGELFIGGDGLARGYLRRPELTSEKFISNPFSTDPSARLYKTGDLARYLPDGNLEYLGRIDHQVKVRGYRIELGEIEAVLTEHPSVKECVVAAREDEPDGKRLVAYLIPALGQAPGVSELRNYVKGKLPDFMVPSLFVTLDSFPLTPNGKVDRPALMPPTGTHPELEERFVEPRTANEQTLARIWAEVLGTGRVGIHDNFFELGGDSILSLQIVSRAKQAGLQLMPKHVFQNQTVAQLAMVAETASTIQADQNEVSGAVPLTPIQQWFFKQDLPQPDYWNQAFLLKARQALNPTVLQRVVQLLLQHHDALRLRFDVESGWRQTNAPFDDAVPFEEIDLSAIPEAKQQGAIELKSTELQASLNLSAGPLLRVALFHLGNNRPNRLLMVIHHLAVDGVSWRILLEDFQTLYSQLSRGEQIKLPLKTVSFKSWAELLVDYANSETIRKEQNYWLQETSAEHRSLTLDHQTGPNTEESARLVRYSLSAEETRALLRDVPSVYNTEINDVLLTALVQSFASRTGRQELLIDLEGHGREEIGDGVDLSRTIGWFTTIFPTVLRLRQGHNPGEALRDIKEQLRRIPNRGLGYGLLRYIAEDKAFGLKLRAMRQPEISFNYLGQFDQIFSNSALFTPDQECIGSVVSLKGPRSHVLNITGRVVGGQLQLTWAYSKNLHRESTIEALAQSYIGALRSLIEHCQAEESEGFTPADFPLAKLDQKALGKLSADLSKIDLTE